MGTTKAAKQPPRRSLKRRGRRAVRITVIASVFNKPVTEALMSGARAALRRHGIPARQIRCVWVPGAFELPVAAAALAASKARPDAIVAVGCVIKGETPQYAALGQAVMHGLAQVSVHDRMPVGCGVVIADSMAQARARAGGAVGNRGEEAALAALAMLETIGRFNHPHA